MVLLHRFCHNHPSERTRKQGVKYNQMFMHPGIKLRHIRLFLQVADSGNLSAAGRALGLTQPAMSKSLTELEAMLGTPLFTRNGRRMALTAHGETLRRHARDAVASLDAGARALQPGAGRARLSVGLLPTVSTRFFPQVAARFMAENPAVTLAIETGTHPYLVRKLRERQIDLMIGRMPQAGELDGLSFEYLYEEPIVAVTHAPPAPHTNLADLLRARPLILPGRETVIRKSIDDYLAALGLRGLEAAVETSTLALGRGLLLATDAIWFISQGVVEAEISSGLFTILPLGATYLSGAVGMTALSDEARSPIAAPLIALLRQAGSKRAQD